MNSGTLTAGEYTIPADVTLLIPFDDANTMYTTEADSVENTITLKNYKVPATYRKLTMADGAILTVNGTLICDEFGGKVYSNTEGAVVDITNINSNTTYEVKRTYVTLWVPPYQCETLAYTKNAELINGNGSIVSKPTPSVKYTYSGGVWNAEEVKYTIDKSGSTGATITSSSSAVAGETITVTVKYDYDDSRSVKVTASDGSTITVTLTNGKTYAGNKIPSGTTSFTFEMPNCDVEITATSEDDGCVVEGTLVTMADGTQKPVEDLKVGDMLLVFNHFTGQFESAPLIFNTHSDGEADYYDVLHLLFANGEEIKIVSHHGFFDITLMQYVYITYDNYNDYIGHEFYFLNDDGVTYSGESVVLTEAYIANEYTRIFCPVTAFHLNGFTNGALNTPSIPGKVTGLVNYFEYDSDLKYNEEAMARDIEQYGLFTPEDFGEYVTAEVFNLFPAPYFKVSVGKGMLTYEEILDVIEYLLQGSLVDNDSETGVSQSK